jgi:GDP-4-dehydro-6-deoxy-D-mannose reductase
VDARAGAGGAGGLSGPPLVTGGAGFAGSHLVALLRERGEAPAAPPRAELDLLEPDAVRAAVRELQPRVVFHLAAQASPWRSWAEPGDTLSRNVLMTLNVLEAVRAEAREAAVLVAGSGEVYGPPERLPVGEEAPLRPQNPYAVSKAACDLLAGQYADAHDLHVVRTRAFNHAGPGQSDEYVVGTITRQVAEAQLAGAADAAQLRLGNLDARRDFTDVRDVARAYVAAVELDAGAYNVCSGRTVSIRELVELLARVAEFEIHAEVEPGRLRTHEVPEVRGSADRLRRGSGWEPEIPLERTLADALAAWRERLAVA